MSASPQAGGRPGARVALVVGCGNYSEARLQPLPHIARAARELAAVLGDPARGDFDVELLTDPIHAEVEKVMLDFRERAARADLALIVWAGHGIGTGEDLVLLVEDSSFAQPGLGFGSHSLRDQARHFGAAEVLVILDVVAGMQPTAPAPAFPFARGPRAKRFGTLRADSAPAEAKMSLTEDLAGGLGSGEADLDGDGTVTFRELRDYVISRGQQVAYESEGADEVAIAQATKADVGVSPSIRAVEKRLKGDVPAAALVSELVRLHPDYAAASAPSPRDLETVAGAPARTSDKWVEAARQMVDTARAPTLHGRLLICALALLDPALRERLTATGFLAAVEEEIDERVEDLLLPRWREAWSRPDTVPMHSDRPATVDRLGREALAEAIAARLEHERQLSRPMGGGRGEAFMVHLYGPWGSGKTSLLNLLAGRLRALETRWVVVTFNAWQFERIGPPWWGLMQAVLREASRDPFPAGWWRDKAWWKSWHRGRVTDALRSLRLIGLDLAWRVRLAWMAFILLPVVAFVVWRTGALDFALADLKKTGDAAKAIAAVVTLAVTLVGAARGLSRSLAVGSARGARAFVASTRDPMRVLKRRFGRLVRSVGRPVCIFIDDLDRCQASYVVEVLQGIQTMFLDEAVTYVVAADRRWLYGSYEQVYADFAGAVQEPGRPLGHLFLEKTFQLAVPVPNLDDTARETFWHDLILVGSAPDSAGLAAAAEEAERELEDAHDENAVRRVAAEAAKDADRSPAEQLVWRTAAVRRLADPELKRRTEHTLRAFAGLVERNPRAMKRLVNAYGIERDLRFLAGRLDDGTSPGQLALWVILQLRWPLLAEHIASSARARANDALPEELAELARAPEVRAVIEGHGVGSALTKDAVSRFVG